MDETLRVPSVTGIDVELDLAGPGGRSYAFVIDWHIRALISAAWLGLGLALETVTGAELGGFSIFAFVVPAGAIYLLYHPILEIAMDGRTPGKRMAGIRIVTKQGESPDATAHLIRNVFRVVDQLPGFYAVGLATTMLTRQSARIGDLAAGTVLVYDDDHEPDTLTVHAGDSEIGLQQAELVGELVERWPELEPGKRAQLARALLRRLGVEGIELTSDDDLLSRLEALLER